MAEQITIGDLVIAGTEEGMTFRSPSLAGGEIRLQPQAVHALFDFLRSSAVNPANRRRGFRIPLDPSDGLRATVRYEAESLDSVVRDISLSGICVEPIDESAPELPVGAAVGLTLHLGDAFTEMRSQICRRAGSGYGVMFLDAVEGDQPAPPPAFARMIAQIERRWLAERVVQ